MLKHNLLLFRHSSPNIRQPQLVQGGFQVFAFFRRAVAFGLLLQHRQHVDGVLGLIELHSALLVTGLGSRPRAIAPCRYSVLTRNVRSAGGSGPRASAGGRTAACGRLRRLFGRAGRFLLRLHLALPVLVDDELLLGRFVGSCGFCSHSIAATAATADFTDTTHWLPSTTR